MKIWGKRLLQKGYTLLSNHDLKVHCNIENSLLEVLERYWRWHVGRDERMTLLDYLRLIKNSIKPMAQEDLNSGNRVLYYFISDLPSLLLFQNSNI